MAMIALDDEELGRLYTWVDAIPLSRPKRNITRDFSDGVLLAEVVHHYFPKLVELHNYSGANSIRQKMYNWATLNQKCFRRIGFVMEKVEIESIVNCKPGAVELLLMRLQRHIAEIRAGKRPGLTASGSPTQGAGAGGFITSGSQDGAGAAAAAAQAQAQFTSAVNGAAGAGVGAGAGVAQPQHAAGGPSDAGAPAGILAEKDATIRELTETIDILELKVKKLEQLVRLKDSRIQTLTARLTAGGAPGVPA